MESPSQRDLFTHLNIDEIEKFTRKPPKDYAFDCDFSYPLPHSSFNPRASGKTIHRLHPSKLTDGTLDLKSLMRNQKTLGHAFKKKLQVAKTGEVFDRKKFSSKLSIPGRIGVAPFPVFEKVKRRVPTLPNQFKTMNLNLSRFDYPWTTIGKLTVFGSYQTPFANFVVGSSGTATVIGRHTLITASHVLPWGCTTYWGTFTPALSVASPQAPFGSFSVNGFWGYINSSEVCGYDCSVVSVDRPVGDVTGSMGWYSTTNEDFYEKASFFSAGYQGAYYFGNEPSIEMNIKVDDIDNDSFDSKEIEVNRFSNKGWSGGPLFTWLDNRTAGVTVPGPYVCGILSGREDDGWFEPERTVFSAGRPLGVVAQKGAEIFR
jgi:hypothetical protein